MPSARPRKLRPLPEGLTLEKGAHESPDEGLCLLELAAYLAGRKHSDSPPCVCPVLAEYGRALNDALPDAERQRLIPLAIQLVGTKTSPEVERARAYLFADAAVREFAPLAFDAAGLVEEALKLRELAPVTDESAAMSAAWSARSAAPPVWEAAIAVLERAIDITEEGAACTSI